MIDDVFAVIADSTRRQILQALRDGARPVGELVDELEISQPTVSKHLKVLRNAGLVKSEAAGQKRFYSITPEPLEVVAEWVAQLQAVTAVEAVASTDDVTPEKQATSTENPVEVKTLTASIGAAPLVSNDVNNAPEEEALQDAVLEVEQTETALETTESSVEEPAESLEVTRDEDAVEDTEEFEPVSEETEINSEDETESAEVDFFELGEEGGTLQNTQPSQSLNSLDFTPMESFTPFVETADADDPTTSIDLASIPLIAAEESIENNLDVVAVEEDYGFVATTDDSLTFAEGIIEIDGEIEPTTNAEADSIGEDGVPSGYVAYTGEDESPEFIDDVPETDFTDEQNDPTATAVLDDSVPDENTQSAPETVENAITPESETENHESRGFLASLTRWGRRRSR